MARRLFHSISGLLFAASLAIVGISSASADDASPPAKFEQTSAPAKSEPRVARLIRQLGSDSYRDRILAGEELQKSSAAGRSQLEIAARSEDPEVRLRATELLHQMRSLELWTPSLVSHDGSPTSAARLIESFTTQSNNHIRAGDSYGTFQDSQLGLKLVEVPYWSAVDELCRRSGNKVRLHYDNREPGIALIAGRTSSGPLAYAGPLRAQVTQAHRQFQEKLTFAEEAPQQTHTFELEIQVLWEDRFRLVAFRNNPEVVEAVTDTGVVLTPQQPNIGGWQVVGPNMRQLTTRLAITPPPVAAKQLDRLTLRWGMIAIGSLQSLSIGTLTADATANQDDVELTIDSIEPRDKDRYDVTVLVSRDLVLPDPQEILFQEYKLELRDAAGRAWRVQSPQYSLSDRGVQIRSSFHRETGQGDVVQGDAVQLVLLYPAIRSQRDLEIAFRGVPMPTGRPK